MSGLRASVRWGIAHTFYLFEFAADKKSIAGGFPADCFSM
jgi:hypothetical protein